MQFTYKWNYYTIVNSSTPNTLRSEKYVKKQMLNSTKISTNTNLN